MQVPVAASHKASAPHSAPLSSQTAGPLVGSLQTWGWASLHVVAAATHASQVVWLAGVSEFVQSVLEPHVARSVQPVRPELQVCKSLPLHCFSLAAQAGSGQSVPSLIACVQRAAVAQVSTTSGSLLMRLAGHW
jgi:hypothetical protein